MATSMLGQELGRYRLVEELGRGAMATVYRAEDRTLGRAVAVKVLHLFLIDSDEVRLRFLREARAIAALRHPNIIEVYDFHAGDGEIPPHLVTELVRGPSLAGFVAENGIPLPETAALIVLKVAQALAVAHRAGIVHRDVKPHNVLIDQGGRIVLGDFGIARVAGDGTVTKSGALLGSPAYMSPEQARSGEIDARSDVFSLGTMLYFLLTGRLPFRGSSALAIIQAILDGRHALAGRVNPRVSHSLEEVVERCLAHNPAARFDDGDAVASALRKPCDESGLGDPDAELRGYFAGPGEYNAALVPRIVASALAAAREARRRGLPARALRACDRVLSFEPSHAEARALVASLGRRNRLRRIALAAGFLVVLAMGAVAVRARRSSAPAGPPAAIDAGTMAAEPAREPVDAAVLAAVPVRRAPPRPRPPGRQVALGPAPTGGLDAAAAEPPPPAPDLSPPPPAHLSVRAIPYCQPLLLDGHPLAPPYAAEVAPGRHVLRCLHPQGARQLEIALAPGPNPEVVLRVFEDATIDTRGLSGELLVDGRRCEAECRIPVGAVTLELRAGGRVVESRPLFDLPPGRCRLFAAPLRCTVTP